MRGVKHHSAGFVLSDAVNALTAIETEGVSLDDVLDSRLAHPELRRTVSSLLFQYFRRKRFIDTWIARLASRPPRPPIRRVLAVALTLDCVVLAAFVLLIGTNLYYERRM